MRYLSLRFVFLFALFAAPAIRAGEEAGYLDRIQSLLSGGDAEREAQVSAPAAEIPSPSGQDPAAPEPIPTARQPREAAAFTPAVRVRVTAKRHTILSSMGTGRIEEFSVRDGDHFEEGDVLVRLDDSMILLQRRRAQASLDRAQVLYSLARELADMKTRGEAEAEVAGADLEQARADLESVDLLLSRSRIGAPFSGRVADVFAREKQFVGEGTPLLEILDDSTLELEFIVPSRWIRWFTPGYRFSVTIEETGKTHEAVLERLGGKVDPLSQSMKAYAILEDADDDLVEGMSGSAHIDAPEGEDA